MRNWWLPKSGHKIIVYVLVSSANDNFKFTFLAAPDYKYKRLGLLKLTFTYIRTYIRMIMYIYFEC